MQEEGAGLATCECLDCEEECLGLRSLIKSGCRSSMKTLFGGNESSFVEGLSRLGNKNFELLALDLGLLLLDLHCSAFWNLEMKILP